MKITILAGLITLLAAALLGSPSSLWAQESAADAETPAASALDEAIADLEAATPGPRTQRADLLQRPPSRSPQLRLIDVSLDVLLFAGFSSENDDSISTLQGGGHDP